MTNQEKVKFILNKFPETKFNRADFFLKYIQEFFNEGKELFYITKDQFKAFWKDFAGVERSLRDILKEPKYRLPIKADAKRYKQAAEFRDEFRETLSSKEKKQYDLIFK